MTKNSKLLLGVLGAVTAGVVIGLLIAPEKGKDIRKKLKKTADEWSESLNHLYEKGKEKFAKSDLKQKVDLTKESLS